MQPDLIITLDWSAAGTPRRGKDSIWLACATAAQITTENIPDRLTAEARLTQILGAALTHHTRVLLVADFAFGGPAGLAQRLTGQAHGLALWSWLAARITEKEANASNYRMVAAQMNRALSGGAGPFWGNGARADIADLPRTKPDLPPGLAEYRLAEARDRATGARPKALWQLAGAGAVGAQSLTGIAMLARLRAQFAPQITVWPFEAPTTPIVLAEGYFSMMPASVRTECAIRNIVVDEAQVHLMAKALRALAQNGELGTLMTPDAPAQVLREEGWYLAAGQGGRIAGIVQDQAR
jgi:molybdopterin molybdotransferase